jgi:hypothetical protein
MPKGQSKNEQSRETANKDENKQICVVLLCVFTLSVQCREVRYYFHIETVFGSSLPLVVCRRVHVLFALVVFACVTIFPESFPMWTEKNN